jgi:hypothetical protein
MSLYEPLGGFDFIFTRLNPLATGGAFVGIAPPDAATPYTVYSLQAGADLMVINGIRVWNDGLYLVKACGPVDESAAVYALAASNDAALHRQQNVSVESGAGVMLACVREQTVVYSETVVNGGVWLNAGGLYRVYVQAS